MKIYKKDTRGKIRELDIYTIENTLYQKSGLLEGKKVEHSKECSAKNIGKSNETTGGNQAILEKEALITKKLKEGYYKTIKEANVTSFISPMLAKVFEKEEKKVIYPCYIQPKFDGIRCLAIMKDNKIILMSRKNREFTTLDHLKKELMSKYKEGTILDGEIYAHGKTFQENTKLVKKYRKGETELLHYHIYDIISDKPFKERILKVSNYFNGNNICLESVPTYRIESKGDIPHFYKMFLKQKFEGAMVRWGTTGYKINGRSSNLLKVKTFKDVALPIIDIVESDKMPGHGIVVIEYNGHSSKTGSKISHEDRQDLWVNRTNYIGKTAEIRYFEETDKGALRFPIYMGIRLDK